MKRVECKEKNEKKPMAKEAKWIIFITLFSAIVTFYQGEIHHAKTKTMLEAHNKKVDSTLIINGCDHKSYCDKFNRQDTVNIGIQSCFYSLHRNLPDYMPIRKNEEEKIRCNSPNEE